MAPNLSILSRRVRGGEPPSGGGGGATTYRGATLPANMTAPASLSSTFGGTPWSIDDLIVGQSRYNAATTLTVTNTGSTGWTDLANHLTTVAANNADYKIIVPAATLSGTVLTLPAKSFPTKHCWIVVTGINSGSFTTARGTRLPKSQAGMCVIEGDTSGQANVVMFADNSAAARGYSFHGIHFKKQGSGGACSVALLDMRRASGTVTTIDDCPGILYVDRCLFQGNNTQTRRGIVPNGPYFWVEDSTFWDLSYLGFESSAIGCWSGARYHVHKNCRLEAPSQFILFGGADPQNPQSGNLDSADIYTYRCYGFKPLSWLSTHGTYDSVTSRTVKTGFEAKNVRRWVIDSCWTQNCWPDAQNGYAMLFQNLSDGETNHLANRIDDVVVRHHRFDYVAQGLNLLSRVTYGGTLPVNPMSRVVFDNILMTQVGGSRSDALSVIKNGVVGDVGVSLQLLQDVQDLVIDRWTTDTHTHTDSVWLKMEGTSGADWTLTNIVARLGIYGIFRSGGQTGSTAMASQCPAGLTMTGNVGYDIYDRDPSTMGAGWDADETNSTMNFAGYASYNYALTTDHLTKGMDGGVPGCDITTLNTMLSGVDS
jgi:hypothetical protein